VAVAAAVMTSEELQSRMEMRTRRGPSLHLPFARRSSLTFSSWDVVVFFFLSIFPPSPRIGSVYSSINCSKIRRADVRIGERRQTTGGWVRVSEAEAPTPASNPR
jgi:hypothetical protein